MAIIQYVKLELYKRLEACSSTAHSKKDDVSEKSGAFQMEKRRIALNI